MKSGLRLFIWLTALYVSSLVPRDGIGSACSLVFASVHVVLKERLFCPLWSMVYCCQSLSLLSVLLSKKGSFPFRSAEIVPFSFILYFLIRRYLFMLCIPVQQGTDYGIRPGLSVAVCGHPPSGL